MLVLLEIFNLKQLPKRQFAVKCNLKMYIASQDVSAPRLTCLFICITVTCSVMEHVECFILRLSLSRAVVCGVSLVWCVLGFVLRIFKSRTTGGESGFVL
jgi:hypothetical protein